MQLGSVRRRGMGKLKIPAATSSLCNKRHFSPRACVPAHNTVLPLAQGTEDLRGHGKTGEHLSRSHNPAQRFLLG